ncbi:MAG: transposase, partial [Deltaproteobacteria bacterium]|nr:transposase [Deltaproteobacteria bacterium]
MAGRETRQTYPGLLRRSRYVNPKDGKVYVFLTNHSTWAATTIARLYKYRWQVELFFKWIKQHLKVKTFLGTSLNAVMTQICIAMIVFVLVALIK